jgi:hypothetical protein
MPLTLVRHPRVTAPDGRPTTTAQRQRALCRKRQGSSGKAHQSNQFRRLASASKMREGAGRDDVCQNDILSERRPPARTVHFRSTRGQFETTPAECFLRGFCSLPSRSPVRVSVNCADSAIDNETTALRWTCHRSFSPNVKDSLQ